MKKIVATTIIILIGFSLGNGQELKGSLLPLFTKNKIWTEAIHPEGSFIPNATQPYKVWKDTLIDGMKNYMVVTIMEGTEVWDTINPSMKYIEDEGKIYFNGILYYDFTMIPGDTLIYDSNNMVILDSIVNREMVNGETRKHFYVGHFFNGIYNKTFTWIEGIGSTLGLGTPFDGPNQSGAVITYYVLKIMVNKFTNLLITNVALFIQSIRWS